MLYFTKVFSVVHFPPLIFAFPKIQHSFVLYLL